MDIVKKGTRYFFDGTPFKVIYFILTLLSFNSFTAHTTFMPKFAFVVTALGGIVLIYRVVFLKKFIKTPNLLFLGLFLVSFIISALVNWKYGILGNVKGFIWMAFQFCILYACDDRKKPEFYKKEFHILSIVLIIYLTIGVIVSLGFLAANQGGIFLRTEDVIYGFIWGRLWGMFSEPNNAATAICMGIFILFYFFKICKPIWIKIGCWCLIALYSSYLLFSDSRTGLMCLIIGSTLITYLLIINPNKRNWKKISTQAIAIAIALVVGVSCYFGMHFAKKGYNLIQSSISSSEQNNIGNNTQKPNLEIGRDQDLVGDFSNRRFSIWESGIELFRTSPVFGVGFRNIVAAAKDKAPNTYIINNNQTQFASFHSMFVDILASQGIVGITIIAVFIILTCIWLITLLVKILQKDYFYIIIIFSIVISIAASAFVSPDVFYVNTQNAFMFWTFLGYLIHMANKKRQEKKALKNTNAIEDEQPTEENIT